MRQLSKTVNRTLLLFVTTLAFGHAAGSELEFEGVPMSKIEVSDGVVQNTTISGDKAREFRVVIAREGDRYFWASRDNLPLLKIDGVAYVTYVAVTGAGYIRVLSPMMRELRKKLPAEQRDREFLYMEHLIHQMGSITYFGK